MTLWPTRDVAERAAWGVVTALPQTVSLDLRAGDGWRDVVDFLLGQLHMAYSRGRDDERRLHSGGF